MIDNVIIEALLLSGLRNSEFCGLTIADAICAGDAPALIARGRRGASRTVHIPRRVADLLAQYVADVRARFLPADVEPNDPAQPLVFNEHRRPYERSGLYRRVVRILTAAGLGERASVQLLRHTYGYLAYLCTGGNLLFVQRQLGHAHPRITSVYAQLVEESHAEMSERVAAAIDRPTPQFGQQASAKLTPAFDCEID